MRRWLTWLTLGGVLALGLAVVRIGRHPGPELLSAGPRLLSNDTAQPVSLYGKRFAPGMQVRLGAPFNRVLPAAVVDAEHAYLRLPASLDLPASQAEGTLTLSLLGAKAQVNIVLINNRHFPELRALALGAAGRTLLAVSTTTDTGYRLLAAGLTPPNSVGLSDGPTAVAALPSPAPEEQFVVVHRYLPEVEIVSEQGPVRHIPGPVGAVGVVADAKGAILYVAEDVHDTVMAIELGTGLVLWRTPVAPNPRELTLVEGLLAVGSLQAGTVQLLRRSDGALLSTVQPGPEVSILGGHTEPFGRRVMGGKAVRGLVFSARLNKLFVASIGPNVGPNPEHMEVSMNGGVGVIDLATLKFERHLGFGAGVPSALALDERRGILYVADVATGVIHVVDAVALASSDAAASHAERWQVPIPPPADFPRVRAEMDFGHSGRAGVELHSGPAALALDSTGARLWVLNRFTGTVVQLDTKGGLLRAPVVTRQQPLVNTLEQWERRQGEILFYADLGRTGMSCDSCHVDGHTEGVLFTKTHPLRIYRSPTLRDARDTPPYFTPMSTLTLADTSKKVGDRNRYHNPDLDPHELAVLTEYTASLTLEPNPWVGMDGAPREDVHLPNGRTANARQGIRVFGGSCAACHPPPVFTTDQDPQTQGRYLRVGTPALLPLRAGMQENQDTGFSTPSLLGGWDIFPMLNSGSAGLRVSTEGTVVLSGRSALEDVLEHYSGPSHGNAQALSSADRANLWAYLLSL